MIAIRRRPSAWTAAVTGIAFVAVTVTVLVDRGMPLDAEGITFVRQVGASWWIPILQVATFLASGAGAIPIAVVIALRLATTGRQRAATFYSVTCLSGWAAELAIKEVIGRPRPVGLSPRLTAAGWYSYPSGHAMLSVLVFGLGAVLLTRGARLAARTLVLLAAALLIALVALSRVYLGAHWPRDVLGAVLAGIAWGAGASALYDPEPSVAPYTAA